MEPGPAASSPKGYQTELEGGTRLRGALTGRQQDWFDRLSAVEPGLTLAELSARLGEAYATVQRWASFFGYPIRDARRERTARVDWARVDWARSNVEIARELHVSRERVRQVRAQAEDGRGGVPAEKQFAAYVIHHREKLAGKPVGHVIRSSGVPLSAAAARQVLHRLGVGDSMAERNPHAPDWRLPNRDLADIHGKSVQQIANLRFRKGAGPAMWDVRGGRSITDKKYAAARRAEEQRLARKRAKGEPAAKKMT